MSKCPSCEDPLSPGPMCGPCAQTSATDLGTFKGGKFFGGRGVILDPIDDGGPDAPKTQPSQSFPTLADCGCPTYRTKQEEGWRWVAEHAVGCLRIPVRRREAIEHTRRKAS